MLPDYMDAAAVVSAWVAALAALGAAAFAWSQARSAKGSARTAEELAIERQRRRDEREPRLEGRLSDDCQRLELHHTGGVTVDALQVTIEHSPPRVGQFVDKGGDGRSAGRPGITPGGFLTFKLERPDRPDKHQGGTLVLSCQVRSGEDEWTVAVRIDVADERVPLAGWA